MPESVQAENVYAPPEAHLRASDEPLPGVAEREDLRTFIGPRKTDYYLTAWAPELEGRGDKLPFNWAAFFFSGLWIAYRKMYKIAFILAGVLVVESALEEWVFVYMLRDDAPPGLDKFISFAVALLCGVMGNRWYLSHARRHILAARSEGLRGEALSRTLAARGGVSTGAALLFLVLFIAASFVSLTLFELVHSASSAATYRVNDKDDVLYSNGATEEDARVLGELLTKYNYFSGSGASVKIERPPQGLAVSFVLGDGSWERPEVVDSMRTIGEFLAEDHFGRPLSVHLCNRHLEVKKSLLVK